MRDFNTYKELSEYFMKKFEDTLDTQLDADDVVAYATVIGEFASTVKNPDNLKTILQETINHKTKTIEMKDRVSLSNLYNMAALLSGVMNPQDISRDELLKYAMEGDSGYADLRFRMVENVAKRENLVKDDIPTM